MSCHKRIPNFEFAPEKIERTVQSGGLLSMEIEFSLLCNYRCPYCYAAIRHLPENELSRDEIRDIILQARELGAEKIIILGGEPTLYPHTLEMIRFCRGLDLDVEMFTNGSIMTVDLARQLYDQNVRVVLKMNSFQPKVQDMLTGHEGSHLAIRCALENLQRVGYASGQAFLAVSTVICQQNVDELIEMWQWLRDQNIVPYFEVITPQGNATANEWLAVDPLKLHDIFSRIAEIDRERYGQVWDPQPPLVGNQCLRHRFSCLVNSQGDVMPCVGVTIPVGNIRQQKLRNILADSEVVEDLREYHRTIKEPCRSCDKAQHCYGCRGAAYQLTGDYLASDPLCWRNIDRQRDIVRLPVAVDSIIPQQFPMRVIDTLIKVGERSAVATATASRTMPFVNEQGILDEAVYMEMMAQTIAAMNGFKHMNASGACTQGMLVGARKLEIFGLARVGEMLTISVYKQTRYGEFGILEGTVSRGDVALARGEIKIWHNDSENHKQLTAVACR